MIRRRESCPSRWGRRLHFLREKYLSPVGTFIGLLVSLKRGSGVVISSSLLLMWLWVPASVSYSCFQMGFLCSLFLQEPTFLVVRRFGKSVVGVSLGQGGSLTGLKVPSRSRWDSGMGSILLLHLTPVHWVLVIERNTSCFLLWCRSGYFTAYDDSFRFGWCRSGYFTCIQRFVRSVRVHLLQ